VKLKGTERGKPVQLFTRATNPHSCFASWCNRDPVFRYDDSYEISRDEQRKRTLEKIRRSLLYFREEAGDQRKNHVRSGLFSLLEPSHETRMGVHFYLFKPAVENNGTPEQVRPSFSLQHQLL
jgi:hypothetical protein